MEFDIISRRSKFQTEIYCLLRTQVRMTQEPKEIKINNDFFI